MIRFKAARGSPCAPALTAFALLATIAAPAAAAAADAQDEAAPTAIGELVVTAQKRSERLRDVPIAISALTAADITASGAKALGDLAYSVPNFSVQQYGPASQRPQIRGISSTAGRATIGVYLDEMSLDTDSSQAGMDVSLLDVERVEVLRGPQGTLYGEGSMGGTVRYITASPTFGDAFFRFESEASTISDGGSNWRAAGVANLPLGDTLAVRVAAGHDTFGGWIDNTLTGARDVDSGRSDVIRGKLLWRPAPRFTASLMVSRQVDVLANQHLGFKDRTTNSPFPQPVEDRYTLVNAVLTYDFGPATLLSSTGYLRRDYLDQWNATCFFSCAPDGTPFLNTLLGLPDGTITGLGLRVEAGQRIWTQEARLSSNGSGPLQYTAGAFYRHSDQDQLTSLPTAPTTLPFAIIESRSRSQIRSWAAFGQASWRFAPLWDAAVGLRYYSDRQNIRADSVIFGAPSSVLEQASFHAVSPRFNLNFRPDNDLLVYASVAKGFRSGGANPPATGACAPGFAGNPPYPSAYEPEAVWSYEAGAKRTFLGGRLEAEGAAYYDDWKGIQLPVLQPSTCTYTVNAGRVHGWGVELSGRYRPTDRLTVNATLGYVHSRFVEVPPETTPPSIPVRNGDPTNFVAPWTWSVSAQYDIPLRPGVGGHLRAEYQHTDRYQYSNRPSTVAFSDARNLINLSAGLRVRRLRLEVFVRNLLDDDAIVFPDTGLIDPVIARPRTVGLGLRYNP